MPSRLDWNVDRTQRLTPLSAMPPRYHILHVHQYCHKLIFSFKIPGKHSLQGSHLDQLQSFNVDRASQFLPGQQRNVTFVSRLQSVQAAVDSQLADMAKKHPDRRVAVITFNSNVSIFLLKIIFLCN